MLELFELLVLEGLHARGADRGEAMAEKIEAENAALRRVVAIADTPELRIARAYLLARAAAARGAAYEPERSPDVRVVVAAAMGAEHGLAATWSTNNHGRLVCKRCVKEQNSRSKRVSAA